MKYLAGYAIGYGYLFAVIGLATVLNKTGIAKASFTRKMIHTMIAFTWLVLYRYFYGSWQILVMPLSFIVINFLSVKLHLFKAMERDGKHDYGTVYYAVAITVMMVAVLIFPNLIIPSGAAVFCLSFGDGAAAVVGEMINKHNPELAPGKSLWGTVACAVFSAAGLIVLGLFVETGLGFPAIAATAVAAALLELFGGKWDNFTVSFGVMIITFLFGISA